MRLITADERKCAEVELLVHASPTGNKDDAVSIAALAQFSANWRAPMPTFMKMMGLEVRVLLVVL